MIINICMQRIAIDSVIIVQGTAVPGTQGEDWPGAGTGDGEGEAGVALHSPPSLPGAGKSQIRYYISSPPASIYPRSGPITDQVLYLLSTRLHLSQERANHRSGTIPPLHPAPSFPGAGQSQIRYYGFSLPAIQSKKRYDIKPYPSHQKHKYPAFLLLRFT
jgi:hypothetical protein